MSEPTFTVLQLQALEQDAAEWGQAEFASALRYAATLAAENATLQERLDTVTKHHDTMVRFVDGSYAALNDPALDFAAAPLPVHVVAVVAERDRLREEVDALKARVAKALDHERESAPCECLIGADMAVILKESK